MTYITVCDARQPVPIDIKEGNSISMTSMSLIYDFYNINKPQDVIKYEPADDADDRLEPLVEYEGGINFVEYYEKFFRGDTTCTPTYYDKDDMIEKKSWFYYREKIDEYEKFGKLDSGETVDVDSLKEFHKSASAFAEKARFLTYYKINVDIDYIIVKSTDENDKLGLSFKAPSFDSRVADYLHERLIRDFPNIFSENGKMVPSGFTDKKYVTKKQKIDDILAYDAPSTNRKHYYKYIMNSIKCFKPSLYFESGTANQAVFVFLRINSYIHGIINFIKNNYPIYYSTISNNIVEYYDKSNITGNDTLIKIIDRYYGGGSWKCFTPEFIPILGQLINTSIRVASISPGFYTLSSLLNFHFENILEFDYNKYTVVFKDGLPDGGMLLVRLTGSNSDESHGELYDLLWSKDSGRRFPDIIGSMKHINVHCEQINALESVFIDHDGNQRHNKMIGTIKINPSGGEFFGTRNDYDNERKIYFKLASPIKHITHLNFYFTDCDGKRITLNGPVLLHLVIQ